MQGNVNSPAPCKTKTEKTMEKKFYEMPEVEVIDLELEGALLSDSDTTETDAPILDGDGDTSELG